MDRLSNIKRVDGSYYPRNPEKNCVNYHTRIDFVYTEKGLTLRGSEVKIEGEDAREIMLRIRDAIIGALSNPKREEYPVLIRGIEFY